MKTPRFSLLILLLALGSILLSACGGTVVHTWPEVSTQDNTVYLSFQGRVYALDAGTGKVTWQYPQSADNGKPFYAAPAVGNGVVAVGNYAHQLYLLDSKTGAPKWTAPFDPGVGNFVATPLIVNDTILAPTSNSRLFAVSLTDGKERWVFESSNMLWATPASDGSVVYVPALDHHMYALNLSDGKQVWAKDLGSALQSAPLLTKDGTLYVSTLNGDVVAMKAQDGSIVWRKASAGGRLWAAPLLNNDTLYVGSDTGKVTAMSVKDGSHVWTQDAGSPIIGSGALTQNSVIFPTEGGKLFGWGLDGKTPVTYGPVNGKLYSTPVVAGQTLVAAITEGKDNQVLQAFSLSGQAGWSFTPPK